MGVYPEGNDAEWEIPWGKVFQKLKAADLDERAGQFAEALLELRVQEDTLDMEIETVGDSCNQLLMTAYREALLAHLKMVIDEVSAGLAPEVVEACRQAANNPRVIEGTSKAKSKAAHQQALLPKAAARPG